MLKVLHNIDLWIIHTMNSSILLSTLLLAAVIFISACDPTSLETNISSTAATAESTTESGFRLGLYETLVDGDSELATMSDAWIEMVKGEAGGDGSFDSPIKLWGEREYSFQIRTGFKADMSLYKTHTYIHLQDIDDDQKTASLADIHCSGIDCTQQSVSCVMDLNTLFTCRSSANNIETTNFVVPDMLKALGLTDSELPTTVRLDVFHCPDLATICDSAAIAYVKLGEQ